MTGRRLMRAALLEACGQPLRIVDDVEIDAPRPGEALVRITHSGVCHTDLTIIEGPSPFALPVVMGHEAAGEIVAFGGPSDEFALGDRVVVSIRAPCDDCFFCKRDQPVLCEKSAVRPGEGEVRLWRGGQPVSRGLNLGAFAEYVLVPLRGMVRVPDAVSMAEAAVCGCAMQTAMGSVVNVADCDQTTTACVIGLGGVGLAIVMALKAVGARQVTGIDPVEVRRATAQGLGANLTLAADDQGKLAKALKATDGRGFDTVFDCVASSATSAEALALARPGGEVVLIGVTSTPQPPGGSTMELVMRHKRLTGSFLGNAHTGRDIPIIFEAICSGTLPVARLITHTLPLERINDALDLMRRGEGVRTILTL